MPQAASATPDTLPPPRAPGDSTIRPTGTLRPGDILQLKVYRDSELTGSYLIEANGFVQIPGLGTIRAAGLRPDQVTQAMVEAMRAKGFREPELAVRPMIRLSVLGQVRTPMLYSIDPGLSLLQLITLAGGPGERADQAPAETGEPRGARPYRAGDNQRHVHWRATAHIGYLRWE